MNTFQSYKKSLENDKYNPLPVKEVNVLVLRYANEPTDELREILVNAHLRIALKAMERVIFNITNICTDDIMELVCVVNETILDAMRIYKHDGLDFNYFCFTHCVNYTKQYRRRNQLVKVRKRKGVKLAPSLRYEYIDAERKGSDVNFDYTPFELKEEEEEKLPEGLSKQLTDLILSLDVKEYKKEVFLTYLNFSGETLSAKETEEKSNITQGSFYRIRKEIIDEIRKSKSIEGLKEIYYL